jgi:hypothetical protein
MNRFCLMLTIRNEAPSIFNELTNCFASFCVLVVLSKKEGMESSQTKPAATIRASATSKHKKRATQSGVASVSVSDVDALSVTNAFCGKRANLCAQAALVAADADVIAAIAAEAISHLDDIRAGVNTCVRRLQAQEQHDPAQGSFGDMLGDVLGDVLGRVSEHIKRLGQQEHARLEQRIVDIDAALCALDDACARQDDTAARAVVVRCEDVLDVVGGTQHWSDEQVLARPDLWPTCPDTLALRALCAAHSMHAATIAWRLRRVRFVMEAQAKHREEQAKDALKSIDAVTQIHAAEWAARAAEAIACNDASVKRELKASLEAALEASRTCLLASLAEPPLITSAPLGNVVEIDVRHVSSMRVIETIYSSIHADMTWAETRFYRRFNDIPMMHPLRYAAAGALVHVLYAALVWRPDVVEALVMHGLMDVPLGPVRLSEFVPRVVAPVSLAVAPTASGGAAAQTAAGVTTLLRPPPHCLLTTDALGQRLAMVHQEHERTRRRIRSLAQRNRRLAAKAAKAKGAGDFDDTDEDTDDDTGTEVSVRDPDTELRLAQESVEVMRRQLEDSVARQSAREQMLDDTDDVDDEEDDSEDAEDDARGKNETAPRRFAPIFTEEEVMQAQARSDLRKRRRDSKYIKAVGGKKDPHGRRDGGALKTVPDACVARWRSFRDSLASFRHMRSAQLLIRDVELDRGTMSYHFATWKNTWGVLFFGVCSAEKHAAMLEFVLRLSAAYAPRATRVVQVTKKDTTDAASEVFLNRPFITCLAFDMRPTHKRQKST